MTPVMILYRLAHPQYYPKLPLKPLNNIYNYAITFFRLMVTAIQYVVVRISIFERKWFWFDAAIKKKNLRVPSQNIASLAVLPTCLSSVLWPLHKGHYRHVGLKEGLRIHHDIIYRPASGLCLGMSLTFLSAFLSEKNEEPLSALTKAAMLLQKGGNKTSVAIQALYDALLGVQGTIDAHQRNECRSILRQDSKNLSETVSENQLGEMIKLYMDATDHSEGLRHFILDRLEKKSIEITPDLYALVLEVDALWHLYHPQEINNNKTIHDAILETISHQLNMEVHSSSLLHGKIPDILENLREMAEGCYLLQFANHAVALVKTEDLMALFVPNEGLGLFDEHHQQEAGLSDLLNYYGRDGLVACEVVSLTRR